MTNNNDDYKLAPETTEQRILKAAEDEFLKKGFTAARTTSIAEAAGVTHAMLHYYYRTKEKLFDTFINDKLTALARTLIINIDDTTPLSNCIKIAVERHFDFVCANPLLPRFLVSEVFPNDTLMELFKEKVGTLAISTIAMLQKKINNAVAKEECNTMDATTLLLDIVSVNVFPILASPLVCKVKNIKTSHEYEEFLRERKKENVKMILCRLYA